MNIEQNYMGAIQHILAGTRCGKQHLFNIPSVRIGNPLRKLVILGMNQLKQGKGPLVAKTVATTLIVVFTSVLHNALQIRKRLLDTGAVNSTDEILMADRSFRSNSFR
ncbi:hypothetical protein OIU78_025197 [Salix suchowensis]|nr:hypothetical protein OIU78_025197 [Salix suchowensis]